MTDEFIIKGRVTVAIPTFNRLPMLERAVESSRQQTYADIEIVISDNGSADGTKEYIKSLTDSRIRVIQHSSNLGMVRNWDSCLSQATGEYILLLSDDDYFQDTHALTKFVDALERGVPLKRLVVSAVSIVKAHAANSTISGIPTPSSSPNDSRSRANPGKLSESTTTVLSSFEALSEALEGRLNVLPCATMIYTADLRALGGYGAFGAKLAVDTCVWQSICIKTGGLKIINEKLLVYSLHQSESTASIELWGRDQQIVHQLALDLSDKYLQPAEISQLRKLQESAARRLPMSVIKRNLQFSKKYTFGKLIRDIWNYRSRIASSLVFFYLPRMLRKPAAHAFKYIRTRGNL